MNSADGLIFAYILKGDGCGTAIDWHNVNNWHPDMGTLWIHLDYSEEKVKRWLQADSKLSVLSSDILMEEDTRPRFISTKEGFLLILRGVNCNPGSDPEDMVALRMSFEEKRIITMRQRRVMAINDIHGLIEAGNGPRSAIDFLLMVIDRIVDRMGDVVDVDVELIDSSPATINKEDRQFVGGVVMLEEELMLVLSLEMAVEH